MTHSSIALTWTAPSSNGGNPITEYQISYIPSSGGLASNINTGSTRTSYTLFGLNPGTSYIIKASAISNAGIGTASSPISAATLGKCQNKFYPFNFPC